MKPGDIKSLTGYITLKKFVQVAGSLRKIEEILGFHSGRLREGAFLAELCLLPKPDEFELAGYSQVAAHRFPEQFRDIEKTLDITQAKKSIINYWSSKVGASGLVKILPVTKHSKMNDDDQYPPGLGVPQWKLIRPVPMKILSFSSDYPNGKLI